MRKTWKKLLAVMMMCAVLMMNSGCAVEKICVGYTIYPMQYVLERIAGNYIDIVDFSDGVNPIQVSSIASDYKDSLDKTTLILKIGDLEPYWMSRGSAGEYQADERAGVARLSWRVSGR